MPGLNRRSAFAGVLLPLLVLATAGWARATVITINTLTEAKLATAINVANTASTATTIKFSVSGILTLTIPLPAITNASPASLTIDGSGQTVTIDGANLLQIFSVNSGATLNLQNLTIAHGFSSTGGGGVVNNGTLTVTDCTFSVNAAGGHGINGGGIFNNGMLMVTNSIFSDNVATDGGGGIANEGMLMVNNSTFSDDTAEGGGAIVNFGTSTVTNSTFSDNTATGNGGAFFNAFDATLTVTNCTFSGNSAPDGGGGIFTNAATLKVTNSTFSSNSAGSGPGGGIYEFSGGSLILKGTILAAESSGGNCSATVTDAGYNISDDATCGFGSMSKNSNTTLNLITPPSNNGGPTQTIALGTGSSAIGFDTDCTDQQTTPQPILFDQRQFTRPNSPSKCDSGAYEHDGVGPIALETLQRVQIARSSSSDSDEVNLAFTFTDNGVLGVCDSGNDALNGVGVDLFSGTCDDLGSGGLLLDLAPWVIHTVAHVNYGTIFQSSPTVPSPETVSATIVQLLTPLDSCGEWSLNVEVAGLDTAALNLGGTNPFALVVQDADKNVGCFNVTNAIVGSQIDPPKRTVRRDVRR